LSLYNVEVIGSDTVYKSRHRLEDGYVMDISIYVDDYFTDIPINKIVAYNEAHGSGSSYPLDTLLSHVIDKNPFIEFYKDTGNLIEAYDSTRIRLLNEMIRNGDLEKHLVRLK
jgi:hypothetical protein